MKYIKVSLITIFLSIFSFIGVDALENTNIRDENNNYGVNKKEIVITDSNKSNILATPMVDASEKIYDNADLLDEDEEKKLFDLVGDFIKETNMDMVILTDDKSYYSDRQNETYATDFYDYNDFGMNFERYSGILLYRNAYENDPYYDIYTFGNAQLYYDDERLNAILDSIYSDMRGANYEEAFAEYISMCKKYYYSGVAKSKKNYYVDEMGFLQKKYTYPWLIAIVVSGIVAGVYAGVFIGRNKMVKKAREAQDYLKKEDINMYREVDQFLNSRTTSYTVSSSSGGGSGGGSHSGSSGMGHSSGGGRHG